MKRKKYSEELEARLSDDDVKVIVKAKKANPAASKEPALQLFVVSSSHCCFVPTSSSSTFLLFIDGLMN